MNDKTNDSIYTAQDIEEYLSGELTPLQMHRMEKAALDDLFLAEAMEGYAGSRDKEWHEELAALKNKFVNTGNGAKVIAMAPRKNNWWKVAAAVLLIGSTASVAYLLVNKKDKIEIAKNIPVTKQEALSDSLTTAPSTSETLAVTPGVKKATEQKNSTHAATAEHTNPAIETIVSDSAFVYTPGRQKEKADLKQNAGTKANAELEDVVTAKPATAVAPPVTINNAINGTGNQAQYDKTKTANERETFASLKKEAQLNRNFSAQVVGADNSPLPFANVSIKSENFGTYADAKGNFRLISADSLLTIEVKAAGYQPKFYTLQSSAQQNKIVLTQDDAALNYKAVIGNGTAKVRASRRATLIKDSKVNVEPADGWDNYNTYVDNNLEIPDDILKKDIHGNVELSFDVKSNGTITNIKVDKSLCNNCDEVAKRLIEQGPQWKVKKGKKGKGKVTVQF